MDAIYFRLRKVVIVQRFTVVKFGVDNRVSDDTDYGVLNILRAH